MTDNAYVEQFIVASVTGRDSSEGGRRLLVPARVSSGTLDYVALRRGGRKNANGLIFRGNLEDSFRRRTPSARLHSGMDEFRARRVADALRDRGIDAHLIKGGVDQYGV